MRAGRLKTRRYKPYRRRSWGPLFLLLGALCLGAAWCWQSGGISFFPAPAPTLSPAESTRDSRTLTLPGGAWYALQLGVFESESAAREFAAGYQARGAAGYLTGTDSFHVLAAAYPARADAQAVQANLRTLHGVDAYMYEIDRPEITLRLTGQKAQLDALSDAYDFIGQLADQLYALSQFMDSGEMESGEAVAALVSQRETLSGLALRLQSLFAAAPHDAVTRITDLLSDLDAALAVAAQTSGNARLGAQIKYCQLLCLDRMAAYAQSLA